MIPIRTATPIQRTPLVNYALIVANVALFVVFGLGRTPGWQTFEQRYLILNAGWPALHQFLTYQFLHADLTHLIGNMLFLWVFGNAVNGKMGHLAYLLFYLGGGGFAGVCFSLSSDTLLLGASGSIAAVTTAYLVLFPRSRVTILFFFFIITTFELSAMVLIGIKIVLWDNILAPRLSPGTSSVAYTAHLAGYLFGFAVTLAMLLLRALPRDMFDLLALVKRWHQRAAFRSALTDPHARARAELGRVAAPGARTATEAAAHHARLDGITDLRTQIGDHLDADATDEAVTAYERLMVLDPEQCLPQRHQLTIAREFYRTNRFAQAAHAFERYLASYPQVPEVEEIRLLLGIVYARDLGQYETAERHLRAAIGRLTDAGRRAQCDRWLQSVRMALGKPAPET